MRVGALKQILELLDEDTRVYIREDDLSEYTVKSWSLTQYEDGAELVLCTDPMFKLDI